MVETIKVEHLSDNSSQIKAMEMMIRQMERMENAAKKATDGMNKGSKAAVGSFARLEHELKGNEKALKGMVIGSQAFNNQKAKVDAMRSAYDKAKQGLASHNQQASRLSQIGSAGIAKVAGMVAGVASLNAVVTSVVAELEKSKQIALRSSATERTLEESLVSMAPNIGDEKISDARRMIRENAPALGVSQAGLASLIGAAISAGANDLKDALSTASAVLRLTAGNAEEATALMGGAQDIASAAGSTNIKGALGQVLQVVSQVRSTNMAEFSSNIGSAMAAATSQGQNMQGLSTERTLELAAVVSQILKDQTGANTATTVRQFVTRLDSFMPEITKTLDDGSKATLTKDQVKAFAGTKTFDERVAMMRQVPALALQFLETQREGIGKIAVRNIVQGSETALGFERKAAGAIQGIDPAIGRFNKLTGEIADATVLLRAERRSQANIEALRTGGVTSQSGQAQKIFADALAEVDLPGSDPLQEFIGRAEIKTRTTGGESGAEVVADIFQRLLSGGGDPITGLFKRDLSDEHRAFLTEQLATLREIRDAQKTPVPVNVQGRPKEAPVPAVTIP